VWVGFFGGNFMKKLLNRKSILILMIMVSLSLVFSPAVSAGYSIGFTTDKIQITNPTDDGLKVDGVLPISGSTKTDEVWFCIRSSQNEIEVQKAQVENGKFSIDLTFRFGPGKYTVWAGDNRTSFDGRIRFTVENVIEDNRYTSASRYVDSDNPEIIELSRSLIKDDMTDMEKARAIHDWVAGNIEYDYQAFKNGDLALKTASQTLADGTAVCSGYTFLYAALAREAGLETKVVYGQMNGSSGWENQLHAWNEVLVDNQWISVDTTLDAGYIRNGSFVQSLSYKYFNPAPAFLAVTHSGKEYKVH
jgi:hypothetical protein